MGGNKLEALKQIKTVKSVRCHKDNALISYGECCQCENHKNHKCGFSLPEKRIEILPLNSPHRFNRQLFKSISENIRSETLNYYTPTKILQSVKYVEGYPNYRTVKTKLLSGHYKKDEPPKPEVIDGKVIKGQIFLVGREVFDPDAPFFVYDVSYEYGKPFEIKGEWVILLYLYEVFSLEGFADLKIDGKFYALKTKVINNLKEDLIVAKNVNVLVIGSRK